MTEPATVPEPVPEPEPETAPETGPETAHAPAGGRLRRRRRLPWSLLLAGRGGKDPDRVTVEELLVGLGDRSFGWALLLFALVNLLPMPFGANVVTALPLILISAQMAWGLRHLTLPRVVTRRTVGRGGYRRAVHRLKPLVAPIERLIRPRLLQLFTPGWERAIGGALLAVSIALFLPIPFSGIISAFAIFVTAFGLIERDGLVTLLGLAIGALAIAVTTVAAVLIVTGVQSVPWL